MKEAFRLGGDFHSRTALGMYEHIQRAIAEGARNTIHDPLSQQGALVRFATTPHSACNATPNAPFTSVCAPSET